MLLRNEIKMEKRIVWRVRGGRETRSRLQLTQSWKRNCKLKSIFRYKRWKEGERDVLLPLSPLCASFIPSYFQLPLTPRYSRGEGSCEQQQIYAFCKQRFFRCTLQYFKPLLCCTTRKTLQGLHLLTINFGQGKLSCTFKMSMYSPIH